jgi:hypothetical protein
MKKNAFFLLFIFAFCNSCERFLDPVGTPFTSQSPDTSDVIIIKDTIFENFDGAGLGTSIALEDDSPYGGNSTGSISVLNDSGNIAIKVSYVLGSDYTNRFAACRLKARLDLSDYSALQLKLKGNGNLIRICIRAEDFQNANSLNPWDDYGTTTRTPETWTSLTIPFGSLWQYVPQTRFTVNSILSNFDQIVLKTVSGMNGEHGWFAVDDIHFISTVAKR